MDKTFTASGHADECGIERLEAGLRSVLGGGPNISDGKSQVALRGANLFERCAPTVGAGRRRVHQVLQLHHLRFQIPEFSRALCAVSVYILHRIANDIELSSI